MEQKLLLHLRKKDIIAFPVWKHWDDGGKEYVVPENKSEIFESLKGNYIVLTDFQLNNKTTLIGFCSPQDFSGLDYIQPVIFINDFQLALFREREWTEEEQLEALKYIGATKSEVFPIIYKTKVRCDGVFKMGILTDFNTHKDDA